MFYCNSLAFTMNVRKLISGSATFSKSSVNVWKFLVHLLLKPGLENFEHYFASLWDDCNCMVVWIFFGIAPNSLGLEWKLTFSSPVAIAEFSKFVGVLGAAPKVPEDLRIEVCNIVQEVVKKTIPKKRIWMKAKWLSVEALQIVEKRR